MDHEANIARLLGSRALPERNEDSVARWLTTALCDQGAERRRAAQGLLAALALRCPHAVTVEHWRALLDGLDGESSPRGTVRLVEGLLARTTLPSKWLGRRLARLSCDADLILDLASLAAVWRPDQLTGEDLVAVASRDLDHQQRGRFLVEVVERWCWRGAIGDGAWIEALGDRLATHPRWRFTRALLARRHAGRIPGRRAVVGQDQPRLPRRRILLVQNLDIGQGDEIVRCGVLMALLLALEPEARVDLVTRRAHLYDHPRVRLHDIDDPRSIKALLSESFDGLAWLDEVHAPETRIQGGWPEALATKAAAEGVDLVVEAVTDHDHLAFRRLVVGGFDLRPTFEAARCTPDMFDQLQLLALALGLPWLREVDGAMAEPFVGTALAAARAWLREAGLSTARARRPLAVVQPFGGHAEIKGYGRGHVGELARELEGLVAEGFQLLLLPTASPWGDSSQIARLLSAVEPESRRSVVVAPDPSEGNASDERVSTLDLDQAAVERPDLDHADQAVRLFKYLIAEADLVVAVEGWAAHLAAILDKPVRLVLWTGSYGPDWYPRAAQWADRLSSLVPSGADTGPPLANADRTTLSRARRQLLTVALACLQRPSADAMTLLLTALRSPDPALRAQGASAAAPQLVDAAVGDAIRAALKDAAAPVRAAAATVLLERQDLRRATDPAPATLMAHQAIGALRWDEVTALGDAALPALAAAAAGEASFTRRAARRFLHETLRRRSRQGKRGRPESSPASP